MFVCVCLSIAGSGFRVRRRERGGGYRIGANGQLGGMRQEAWGSGGGVVVVWWWQYEYGGVEMLIENLGESEKIDGEIWKSRPSRAEPGRAETSRAEQSRAEPSSAEQAVNSTIYVHTNNDRSVSAAAHRNETRKKREVIAQ